MDTLVEDGRRKFFEPLKIALRTMVGYNVQNHGRLQQPRAAAFAFRAGGTDALYDISLNTIYPCKLIGYKAGFSVFDGAQDN